MKENDPGRRGKGSDNHRKTVCKPKRSLNAAPVDTNSVGAGPGRKGCPGGSRDNIRSVNLLRGHKGAFPGEGAKQKLPGTAGNAGSPVHGGSLQEESYGKPFFISGRQKNDGIVH
jgi:hypothetical protein